MVYVNTRTEQIYKLPTGIPPRFLLTFRDLDAAQADGWTASKRDWPLRSQVDDLGPGQTWSGAVARLRRWMGLPPVVLALLFCAATLAFAQQPQSPQPAAKTVSTLATITLSEDDQKLLDQLTAQIDRMRPDTEKAQKQAEDAQTALAQAQARLAEAQAFIAQYNQFQASRQAFLNRIAADICQCRTTEVELAPDGKSVVRKPPKP